MLNLREEKLQYTDENYLPEVFNFQIERKRNVLKKLLKGIIF